MLDELLFFTQNRHELDGQPLPGRGAEERGPPAARCPHANQNRHHLDALDGRGEKCRDN